MVGPGHRQRPSADDPSDDLEASRTTVATLLSALVPLTVARRAIAVSVETARDRYDRGESVDIAVEFRNRLPIGVDVPTPRQRRWGWRVDGELEASDERRYVPERPATFSFDGGERKRTTVTWSGRFERTGDPHEFVVPDPGEYEISAFVATGPAGYQPSDSTTIRLE
ncbi:hypothetical protein D8Y22_05840 [Salinadaptatus halalkaliphilus]|uniref:DUF7974 domain-containing protein n=1 Tax=Salinadaptatus halalkaliphilus TaxID=2419781 RepID=A0A4S3TQU2_9EURY|nr:hypothetical protein [Salinadaptatus halalkaliphilus]THE65693.1 hypothetical protein D8Y22_05840 [Salinadaptatus halalkaliphilus]